MAGSGLNIDGERVQQVAADLRRHRQRGEREGQQHAGQVALQQHGQRDAHLLDQLAARKPSTSAGRLR
jgi:hypothetical protein